MAKNKITIREEFAIKAQIYADGSLSPQIVYKLAYPGSIEQAEALADLPANASRWWRSKKVQDYYLEQMAVYNSRKEAERKRIEQEVVGRIEAAKAGTTTDSGLVDYGDPRNQLRKLNEIINTASDPNEALDALKVVIARQGELAPEKRQEKAVRTYLPLNCHECPLYAEKKNQLSK